MELQPFTLEQRNFIRNYSKDLETGDAALFAGAGLSRAAGFVDWRGLLDGIAQDLDLDAYKESDLVALAQYHVNYRQSRNQLSQAIIDNFFRNVDLSPNHYLLARLPIQTIWTTNYDRLLERAFQEAGKLVDVKLVKEDFALQRARDLIIYKMHGDIEAPHRAVLTKDDYENYDEQHPLFREHLQIDLVTKTFLFLGFSFTDPNLEYILSRVRVLLGKNTRPHYAIMKEPEGIDTYEHRRLECWKADLRRFGVNTVSIKEYSDIERLLAAISLAVNRKNVFVSGSAREYASVGFAMPEEAVPHADGEALAQLLGKRLIESGCNLVSGFGVTIGERCVIGALRALWTSEDSRKRVVIRPFPTDLVEPDQQRQRNTRIRHDLISRAGSVVFIAGSQVDSGNQMVASRGVLEEFRIATELKRIVIPVAATGYAAEMIWKEVMQDPGRFYPEMDVRPQLQRLADPGSSVEALADTVMEMVRMVAEKDAPSRK